MLRFAWATAFATVLILALKLTILSPAIDTASCDQLQYEFELEDFQLSLPESPALVIGGQRVRYWDTPPSLLAGRESIRRSGAGLNLGLIDQCFPRLVGFYQPALVVIPLDTAYAANIDGSALFAALQGIVDQRTEYSLDFELWVIAPIKTPRYALTDSPLLEAVKKTGAEWASDKFNVRWLDLEDNFSDESGAANPKLVWPDGNTLNEAGYQRLTDALVAISNERKQ